MHRTRAVYHETIARPAAYKEDRPLASFDGSLKN